MRWLVSGAAVLLLFIVQLGLADLDILGSPNLVLVYLCLLLMHWRLGDVLYLALWGGLLLDFFSATPDGTMMASLLVGVAAAQYLGQALFSARLADFLNVVHVVLGTIGFFLAIMLANQLFAYWASGRILDWQYLASYKLGADVVLNLLALYPVHLAHRLQLKIQARMGVKHEPV